MPLLCFPVRFVLSDEYDEEATGARICTSMSMSMMVEARAGKGKGLATFTYHIIVQWHKVTELHEVLFLLYCILKWKELPRDRPRMTR